MPQSPERAQATYGATELRSGTLHYGDARERQVLIRADRDMGNYLKDSIELLNRPASAIHGYAGSNPSPLHRGTSARYAVPRTLPQAISLNLRPNGSSVDDKTIRLLREKLPHNKDNVTTHEIAKICLQLFEVANPVDYDVRRLAEELEKENGIRRLGGSTSAIRGLRRQ